MVNFFVRVKTTNSFSVPLFWYCFLSLALNIYIYIYNIYIYSFFFSGVHPLLTLFSLFYLREQWDMCLCCIFLYLFWLSLCKIFFIYFLSCPIVNNYNVKKSKAISCSETTLISTKERPAVLYARFYYLSKKNVSYIESTLFSIFCAFI